MAISGRMARYDGVLPMLRNTLSGHLNGVLLRSVGDLAGAGERVDWRAWPLAEEVGYSSSAQRNSS